MYVQHNAAPAIGGLAPLAPAQGEAAAATGATTGLESIE